MLDTKGFIADMQTPPTKLTIKQLREREEFWRALWSWIGDDIKYFVLRAGTIVRVVRRDYKGSVGELGAVKFTPAEIEVHVEEKTYNYGDGKYYYENKVVKVPFGAITWLEFINESIEALESNKPE